MCHLAADLELIRSDSLRKWSEDLGIKKIGSLTQRVLKNHVVIYITDLDKECTESEFFWKYL